MADQPTLMLVDGHSLAFRSYYAFARGEEGGLRTSTGIPTSVCYGFLKSLLDTMEAEKPDYAAVAFDLDTPTFRHELDDSYKEGRPEAPEGFLEDVENLQQLLQAFEVKIFTADGYEADDIIGTLATQGRAAGLRVKILSGDRDLYQLIDPQGQVSVLYMSTVYGRGTANGTVKEYHAAEVEAKLGVRPDQVVDYKALCGDASDNIPGVKGIGAKTAVKLLGQYDTLEAIYADLDNIKGAMKRKLEEGHEAALHSQRMARIITDVDLEFALESCKLHGFDQSRVAEALKRLEFFKFMGRLNQLQVAFGGEAPPEAESKAEPKDASGNVSAAVGDDVAFFSPEETEQAQRVQAVAIAPQIITTEAQLYELLDILSAQKDPDHPVAWDTETSSLEPRDADLVGIGCCWGSGESDMAYIPVGHKSGDNLDQQLVLEALRPILESPDYPKALQNAKYDRLVLRCQGVQLAGVVFDPMLASYVLNPEASHNLTDLSLRFLNLTAQSFEDLVPKGKTIADIDIPQVAHYCGSDVHTTYLLVPKLRAALAAVPALQSLFIDIELPLEPVLAAMEYEGIRVDADYLQRLSQKLETDLVQIEKTAYESAGETFNLGSPKQLSELFSANSG